MARVNITKHVFMRKEIIFYQKQILEKYIYLTASSMVKACWLDYADLLCLQTELHLTGGAGQGGDTLLNGGERKLKISMKIT